MTAVPTHTDRASCLEWPPLDAGFATETMRVEEVQEDGQLVIRADLPGLDCERDLDVRIRNHALEIRAERKPVATSANGAVRHSEFRYGRLWRVLTLPDDIRESEVGATYKNGVLEVRVPTGERARGTRVPVTSGS